MKPDLLKVMFPNASAAFINANACQPRLTPGPEPEKQGAPRKSRTKRSRPESEYEAMLERQRSAGEIRDYVFQGITLRIGDGARYTPDFIVIELNDSAKCVEVKGPYIRPKALVAFRTAKDRYGRLFVFEMHQRNQAGQWSQIL